MVTIYDIVHKNAGYNNTQTPKVLKIIKVNIFLRPEEAMLSPGKSLSYTGKIAVLEKN